VCEGPHCEGAKRLNDVDGSPGRILMGKKRGKKREHPNMGLVDYSNPPVG